MRLISCFSAGREDFSSARSAGLAASGWRERSHGGHLGREARRTSLQGAIDNVSHFFYWSRVDKLHFYVLHEPPFGQELGVSPVLSAEDGM